MHSLETLARLNATARLAQWRPGTALAEVGDIGLITELRRRGYTVTRPERPRVHVGNNYCDAGADEPEELSQ